MAETASNLGEILKSSMESMKEMADANTVVGEPITTPAGTIIIPISKISMGIASGGLDYGGKKDDAKSSGQNGQSRAQKGKNFGGGGGTGMTVTPVGFLVVNATGDVELLSVGSDLPPAGPVESVANLIEKSPDILSRLKNVISSFKKGKGGSEDASSNENDL